MTKSDVDSSSGEEIVNTNQSLYLDTRALLMRAIEDGTYPVGSALPREIDLAAELSVSRNTLRSALALLAEEGIIQRKKRLGTIVLRDRAPANFSMDISSMEGLRLYVRHTSAVVLHKGICELPKHLRRIAGVPSGEEWVLLSGVRRPKSGGMPVGAIDFYVRRQFEEVIESYGRVDTLLYEVIERKYGARIGRIDVVLRPDQVSLRWAKELQCAADLPAINMIEVVRDLDGLPMEVASLVVPQDRMQFTFSISPDC